jgi:fructose-1,6-bisphosphatase I/sedoheptulose-1,7-bisphosphatase
MQVEKTTLEQFLSTHLRKDLHQSGLHSITLQISKAVVSIAKMTSKGALAGVLGSLESQNVQGETQKKLDVLADEAFINALKQAGCVLGLASEENEQPLFLSTQGSDHGYLAVFDPLDGSSNIDVNVSVGSIFSVYAAPRERPASLQDFLRPGLEQLLAGYAVYGPATMLVISFGQGTHGFTLDPESARFFLTHPSMQVSEQSAEFAINASNERFWEPPIHRYIDECKKGKTGGRAKDFNMRWVASMVADVHRILMRGGVFMYPRDTRDPSKPGRLRLMYEAKPMAMIIEQAGGLASTGRERLLELVPNNIHQRVPVVLGSKDEVERICEYHADYDQGKV